MKKTITFSVIAIMLLSFMSCESLSFLGAGASKTIKWSTVEKVTKKKKKNKKVFIEVYTNWCGWCKRMEKTTFEDPAIARYVNTYFQAVKFNAESRDPIAFQGKTYQYSTAGRRGRHELATMFMQDNEKVGYPTLVFMDEELNIIQAVPGYRSKEEFEVIVTYFAEDHYKTTPWTDYEANYKSTLE